MNAKNPNFHRIHRPTPDEHYRETSAKNFMSDEKLAELKREKENKIQERKDENYRKYGGLAQRTDHYIREGVNDDESFKMATEDFGMHYDRKKKRYSY